MQVEVKCPTNCTQKTCPLSHKCLNCAEYKKKNEFKYKKYKKSKNIFNLSKKSDLNEAAKNLYKIFNLIKKLKYKKIYVAKIPNKGLGIAINDRIKHAAN